MRNQVKAVAAMTALGTVALVGLGRGATAPGAISRVPIAAGASIQAAQTPSPAAQVQAAPLRTNDSVASVTADLERDIPAWLADAMVPGLSVALVGDGRVVWTHGFGAARADTKEPVTEHTVFEAASLSKPVFAYAVLKLVDQRLLDLDRPLTSYLPGPYDVVDDPRVDQITARHVLSHRSGFPNWRQGPRDKPPLPIHFTPGERFSYSGEGFVYLSKVIERVTGQPLEVFMKTTVFEPLGMTSSSYVWQERYGPLKAYNHDGLGQLAGRMQPKVANAAASLHTTASDFARFVAAVLNGTGLAPSTARAMLSPQSQPLAGGPNTITRAPGPPVPELAWGLGIGLQRTADGLSFWHWGDNGNNRSFVVAYERPKTGVVVHLNGANGMLVVPALVRAAVGGRTPALSWLDYGDLASPSHTFLRAAVRDGAAAAIGQYHEKRKVGPSDQAISEERLNSIGYTLMRAKRLADAIEIFKLNVEDHPDSFNVHDSLGEAYAANGDRELAIKSYRRSIEINPKNTGGIEALKKLEAVR